VAALGPKAEAEGTVVGQHNHPPTGSHNTLSMALVTPKGQLASRDVDEVIAPGDLGEFGVLPGHVPFISTLRPGVLVVRNGAKREVFAVGVGILEVGVTGFVHVLVTRAQAAGEIDGGAAAAEKAGLQEQLARGGLEGAQLTVARENLEWAQARVDAKARSAAN
jgi:F-type H+-transporting ATPase subunit epsilon